MSSGIPKGPDFLIVGAMKAATTSLADALQRHPSIDIPKKEIHFFNANYNRGINWYENHFSFSPADTIRGEATPTYSFLPHVPYLVHRAYPTVKVIWILRDPIRRTYSNYLHALKKGSEFRSFSGAIDDELHGREPDIYKHYIARSLYNEQVYRWSRYFPKERMYYHLFEDLMNSFEEEIAGVQKFLGVDSADLGKRLPHGNKTTIPSGWDAFRWLRYVTGDTKVFHMIRKRLWPHTDRIPPITKQDAEILRSVFGPHNRQLQAMTGKDVTSCWGY